MNTNVIGEVEKLIRGLMPELDGKEISPVASFEELGMDSLTRVDLLAEVEGSFGIQVPDEEVASFVRVNDVIDFIKTTGIG